MFDILDRYLLKDYLIYFFAILIGLASLYLGVDFLSKFWGMNMPVGKVVEIYGYKLPAVLQQFIPVACLMATLLVITNMSRQSEVLALYSVGIGPFRLASTFIAATAVISAFAFMTFDSLVPAFAKKEILVNRGMDPSQEQLLSFNKTGFWYRSGNVIYNVGRFVPESNLLEDIRVYLTNTNFEVVEMMHAKKAIYRERDWILEDGFVVTYPPTHYPQSQKFKEKAGVIPEKPTDFKTLQVEENTMRLKDLRKYIQRNKSYGLDTTAQQVSYHERLALVFTPLIFVLIAIPFGLRPLKQQSIAKSIGFCFVLVFLYLLMFRLIVSVGKGGHIPPMLSGWITNLIFLGIALFFFVKKE